jgi:hypothetical protein
MRPASLGGAAGHGRGTGAGSAVRLMLQDEQRLVNVHTRRSDARVLALVLFA